MSAGLVLRLDAPDTRFHAALRTNPARRPSFRGIAVMTGNAVLQGLLLDMREELTRFALSRQCNPGEVDDLLQDLYLKLASDKLRSVENPRAYLYQMTNNLILHKRRGRDRQTVRDDAWARAQFGQDLTQAPAATPERVAIDRQLLKQVDCRLSELPERTTDILRRYRIDGESQRTIAEELGISLSAVEKHLQRAYRALLNLRSQLDGDFDEGGA